MKNHVFRDTFENNGHFVRRAKNRDCAGRIANPVKEFALSMRITAIDFVQDHTRLAGFVSVLQDRRETHGSLAGIS
jgi:hypothetical protein